MAWGKHRSSKAKSQLEKGKKSSLTSQEVIESCHAAVLPFSSVVSASSKNVFILVLDSVDKRQLES